MGHRLIQPQRASQVPMEDAAPIVEVLLAQWQVEAVGMAYSGNISGRSAFSEHLLDGITRHQVN